jgi:antitoxin (DNA-binding transcriptional repressor) of toxin-antitoxin stability system
MTDLREDMTNMIDYVSKREETLVVTRHGKPIAILAPFESKYEKVLQRQWLLGNVNDRNIVHTNGEQIGENNANYSDCRNAGR